MKAIQTVTGTAAPLDRSDVDTDQIIPSDWLKRVERTGFEKGLFSEWRDSRDFVLNDERYAGARILVAGPNFGTGSSREHAVWALQQYGFDAVISSQFADIFRNNCTKNGLVPAQITATEATRLMQAVVADPSLDITVDVGKLTVEAPAIDFEAGFAMESSVQQRFLAGLDDIAITLRHSAAIDGYENQRRHWLPSSV